MIKQVAVILATLLAACSLHAGLGDSRQSLIDAAKGFDGATTKEFDVRGHKGLMTYFKDGSVACHIFDKNDVAFVSTSILLKTPTFPEFKEIVDHFYPGVHFNLSVSHNPIYVFVSDDEQVVVGINLDSHMLMFASPEGDSFLKNVEPKAIPLPRKNESNTIII